MSLFNKEKDEYGYEDNRPNQQFGPLDDAPQEAEPVVEAAPAETFAEPAPVYEPTPVVESTYNPTPAPAAEAKLFNDEMGVIAQGTTVHGSVRTGGHLAVAGVVEGAVTCAGNLMLIGEILGPVECNNIVLESAVASTPMLKVRESVSIKDNTEFRGDISCKNISVMGRIVGNINASGNVGISKTAVIEGDITATGLAIEPGAKIKGYVNIL